MRSDGMRRIGAVAAGSLVLVAACGGGGGTRHVESANHAVAENGGSGERGPALPKAPPGSLWADGFGPTLREAALDAKRAVTEQLDARIESQLDARETEDSLKGGSRDISARIKTQSAFEHADLIEVLGDAPRDGGVAVRAYLDRRRAAEVYAEDMRQQREKLKALAPVVSQAITTADAGTLLRIETAPGALLGRLQAQRRIAGRLDGAATAPTEDETSADTLERDASGARRRTVLRLKVEAPETLPPEVRRAAAEAVSHLFTTRGCTLGEATFDPPADGVPAADFTLRLASRDGEEAGLQWRYLGLELEGRDARTQNSFFHFSALPEFAKGGGKGWDNADRALVKAVESRLADKMQPALAALTCR